MAVCRTFVFLALMLVAYARQLEHAKVDTGLQLSTGLGWRRGLLEEQAAAQEALQQPAAEAQPRAEQLATEAQPAAEGQRAIEQPAALGQPTAEQRAAGGQPAADAQPTADAQPAVGQLSGTAEQPAEVQPVAEQALEGAVRKEQAAPATTSATAAEWVPEAVAQGSSTGQAAPADTAAGSGADAGQAAPADIAAAGTTDAGKAAPADSAAGGSAADAGQTAPADTVASGSAADAGQTAPADTVASGSAADAGQTVPADTVASGSAADAGQTAAANTAAGGSADAGQENAAEVGKGAVQDEVPAKFTVAVPQQGPEAYVAICAAVKDQHIDVREWIFYHRAIGINKFYLTDTGSKPPMQSVLEDYINASLVEYTFDTQVPPRVGTHGPQVTIYERCLAQHGQRHTWMAFIDVDEFLVLRDGTPDMPALLKDYEQYGGLVVNWVMFGSSGVQARPKGNTLMSYWKCAPEQHSENCHVKSIVRPPHVSDSTTDPHHFKYNSPLHAVNTRHEMVKGPKSHNVTLERVGLYHYSIKSMEDFKMKMARGSGMGNQKTIDYLYYIDNFTTADCFDAIDLGVQMASFAVY